jgi:uncharacterized protein YbjQ (UPF0145 family)
LLTKFVVFVLYFFERARTLLSARLWLPIGSICFWRCCVAYSIGVGGGITGTLRSLKSGEVVEYSDMLNKTRHLALERICNEARDAGANAVLGIQTTISPVSGLQEMLMVGTASHNPDLPAQYSERPISSDLTNEEMWNVINAGYCPIKLVLGVSVFSLGVAGGIKAMFKSFVRGEITELTYMISHARTKAISMIAEDQDTFINKVPMGYAAMYSGSAD